MEVSKREDLTKKLIVVLEKITESLTFDSIYIEKFLVSISEEFSNSNENLIQLPEFSKWLTDIFQKWKQANPNNAEAIFMCKFIGILSKNEQGFQLLLNSKVLTELTNSLEPYVFKHSTLSPSYISFLSNTLTHTPGYMWIKSTEQWKAVCKLYFTNSNLYVEREGFNFLKAFISKTICSDDEKNERIIEEIFSFLNTYKEINIEDQKCCSVVILLLNLIQSILEAHILTENSSVFIKLIKAFDFQSYLDFLLDNTKHEIILEKVSILQVILLISQCQDKKELLHLEGLSPVIDPFFAMLKKTQFNAIIKLAKYCQVLWNEIRKEINCKSQIGVFFSLIQLWPVLMCTKPNIDLHDVYFKNFISSTTTGAQFFELLNEGISSKVSSKPKNLALKGILSVSSSTECLNADEAVIVFKTMAYILKLFIPDDNCLTESVNFYSSQKETSLCMQDSAILSAVLSALCLFLDKFEIEWSEHLQSLDLFKMTCTLIENNISPPVIVVQLFSLLKLEILNFTFSNSRLIPNGAENSSFDCLMSLLFKRLLDPNWEVRDSCLEVVTAMAELKYPVFEQLLAEKKFYSLVFDIMEGDSESYVRASAIQALIAMLKIETIYHFLNSKDIHHKIINLLQNESEAIVRREAALMIKQLYLSMTDLNDETMKSFYEVMGYSAICDLHWEVKINALMFWEAVTQRIIADQNTVNGYIPNAGHQEESKLESKQLKIFSKLSETGCLYVLLSALNDDCDMPVIRKSGQILSQIKTTLEHSGEMEFLKQITVTNRIPMKRKNSDLDLCEKRKTLDSIARSSCDSLGEINSVSLNTEDTTCSDVVIDEIVKERDINLLGVCIQKEQTVSPQKKILLQQVKPETFFSQMQNFNLERFLEDKQKWLINVEVDLKSLLHENCTINETDETNVMDCY